MQKELELWQFIASHLKNDKRVMLLVVATSSGSSPGRAGYKMAVAADGELCGSVGGGVMEVRLAEAAKWRMENGEWRIGSEVVEQIHQKNSEQASGMICSGRQSVIVKELSFDDLKTVEDVIDRLQNRTPGALEITDTSFQVLANTQDNAPFFFAKKSEAEFIYKERLGYKHRLFIIGGGHCALALSEIMSRLGFHISLFDDRPDLNTLEKNRFAHQIKVIDSYENIADLVPSGDENYIAVMTIGYAFDEIVIRNLFDKDFRYFGVLGSKAKMATLMKELRDEGFDQDRLARIHTPIGLPINSHTPEEIAVSIAGEIISVKNSD
ncbi:MAG: XdhC family protein [Pyrinomonadaceae bacterium]